MRMTVVGADKAGNIKIIDELDMGPKLPRTDKGKCFVCKEPGDDLKRCAKCLQVAYCSRECQKRDWDEHKRVCFKYSTQATHKANKKFKVEGKRASPGPKWQPPPRRIPDVLNDLSKTAQYHTGLALFPALFHALDFAHDLTKLDTHFLAMTLSRNLEVSSTNPSTMYSLIHVEVLPLSLLEKIPTCDATGVHWPLKDFRSTAKELAKDPYFKPMLVGAALVVCMELGVNYDVHQYESVKDALLQGSDGFHSEVIPICRPHIELYRTLPAEPEWKACLKNAFDGYRFKVERQTLTAQEQAIARRDLELGPSVVEKR